MNLSKLILILLSTIASNLIHGQMEFSLEDFGEKITKQKALDRYGYDGQLLNLMDEASANNLYILTETPETRYAFNSDEEYEIFKSKNIVGLTIKTTKDKIDKIFLDFKNPNNKSQIYFKPLGMFGGGMLLIALNSSELQDALKFEGFANSVFNMETKSFDPVSKEKLSQLIKEWSMKYNSKVLSIGFNGVTLEMNKIPEDKKYFVQQLNSICPDAISQVYMSEERMWKTLEFQKILTLWWD